jgi:hypothetical protein
VHVLNDDPGLIGKGLAERAGKVADTVADVAALPTVSLGFDQFRSDGHGITPTTHHVRCRRSGSISRLPRGFGSGSRWRTEISLLSMNRCSDQTRAVVFIALG